MRLEQIEAVMTALENPEFSDWECELFGMGRTIVIRPPKGHEPCWFNRLMQRWFFGCRWVKVKKASHTTG